MATGPPTKAPIITGRGQTEYVALTFDDGPNEDSTSMILDTLKRYNVPASFFLLGASIKKATPELKESIHRMFEDGHFVGSHTMNHVDLAKLKIQEVQQEVEEAEVALKEVTGFRPFLIRTPFGSLNDRAREYLGAKAYIVVHHLTDLRDRSFTRVEPFVKSVADLLPPITPETAAEMEHGGVVLLHDTRITAKALGAIIEIIVKNGYKIVPLSHFMLSTEKRALHSSYRCGRDNPLLLDRLCEQLQANYNFQRDWQPVIPDNPPTRARADGTEQDTVTSLARTEYLYELMREQLSREVAIREEKQTKIENELGQVWNTTLSRIKKTYSQLGERLDQLEGRMKKHEGKLEKELETINWNLAKDLEELIDEIDVLKQNREERGKLEKMTERFQRVAEKQHQQIARMERKLQQMVNVAMGFVLLLLFFLLFASINRGWNMWATAKQEHRHTV